MPSTHDHPHGHDHGHGPDHAHEHVSPQEMHDPAQESLVRALQSSFAVLRWVMIGLIVAYVFSGVFQVQSGEKGLIVRFGELRRSADGSRIFEPGWHVALPDPFDEKIRISGQQQRLEIDTFLFAVRDEDRGKALREMAPLSQTLRPGVDGAMFSGDKNLSHGIWSVEYVITDGDQFVSHITDSPEQFNGLLRRMTENAIVRAVASRRVEEIIGGATEITPLVKDRLQKELNALQAGVEIRSVIARAVEPLQVREAFNEVATAENQRQTAIETAEKEATEKLTKAVGPGFRSLIDLINRYGAAQARKAPAAEQAELLQQIDAALVVATDAGGEVATLLRTAQSRANAVREKIRGEVDEFNSYLDLYEAEPDVARLGIWVQMRETVLGGRENELMYLPGVDVTQIVINRDPLIKIRSDLMQYMQRGGQAPPPRR